MINPMEIRYLNLSLNQKVDANIKSSKNISEHIQRLLDQKKDKIRQLFQNSETLEQQTKKPRSESLNGSQSARGLRPIVPLININKIDLDDIQEYDEEENKQTFNFHYEADIKVGKDEMQFKKVPNTARLNDFSQFSNQQTNLDISNFVSVQDPFAYQLVFNYNAEDDNQIKVHKATEAKQLLNCFKQFQMPFSKQTYSIKGKNLKMLHQDVETIQRCIYPLFTGPVDPKINSCKYLVYLEMQEFKKVNKMRESLNQLLQQKFNLDYSSKYQYENYEKLIEQLQKKQLVSGFWEFQEISAQIPQSRESSRMVSERDNVYMFGGSAREPFNDTRCLEDMDTKFFGKLFENEGEEGLGFPQRRFGNTLNLFQRQLVVFGGGGAYNSQAKMRLTYNDVFMFDIGKTITINILENQKWTSDDFLPKDYDGELLIAPKTRMHHAGEVFGCMLVIHGGISGEDKDILDDFGIYDLKRQTWVKTNISTNSRKPLARYMHAMTVVHPDGIDNQLKYSRALWAQQFQVKNQNPTPDQNDQDQKIIESNKMGIYMFGGLVVKQDLCLSIESLAPLTDRKDEKNKKKVCNTELVFSNELYFIKPDFQENIKGLFYHKKYSKDFDYKSDKKMPELTLEVIKLSPQGKPPIGRCLHAQTFFAKRYLAIFGGRNDTLFKEYSNIALNDLYLYDIGINQFIFQLLQPIIPGWQWPRMDAILKEGLVMEWFRYQVVLIALSGKNIKLKQKVFKDQISEIEREIRKHQHKNQL
ncbi:kelch motif family protein [Stylonychia lemnae]|uniref:Kelch motif family protein n=1 Tax=Stylonychia lemnae TaxID=5949 RepID=A0A078B6E5_STYLE|nr:kelch motif family protein [Stylonychia lemnae]|eukprot:CDW89123.1 kelch motif family protein [Stylonychia lemnae]